MWCGILFTADFTVKWGLGFVFHRLQISPQELQFIEKQGNFVLIYTHKVENHHALKNRYSITVSMPHTHTIVRLRSRKRENRIEGFPQPSKHTGSIKCLRDPLRNAIYQSELICSTEIIDEREISSIEHRLWISNFMFFDWCSPNEYSWRLIEEKWKWGWKSVNLRDVVEDWRVQACW